MVINLAPTEPGRSLAGEADLVGAMGMDYVHIPVDWANPTVQDFAAFEQALSQLGERKALIHCIANFRVTAFYALHALKHLGWGVTEAGTLHASVWQGHDHPVWERFWSEMMAAILGGREPRTPA